MIKKLPDKIYMNIYKFLFAECLTDIRTQYRSFYLPHDNNDVYNLIDKRTGQRFFSFPWKQSLRKYGFSQKSDMCHFYDVGPNGDNRFTLVSTTPSSFGCLDIKWEVPKYKIMLMYKGEKNVYTEYKRKMCYYYLVQNFKNTCDFYLRTRDYYYNREYYDDQDETSNDIHSFSYRNDEDDEDEEYRGGYLDEDLTGYYDYRNKYLRQ